MFNSRRALISIALAALAGTGCGAQSEEVGAASEALLATGNWIYGTAGLAGAYQAAGLPSGVFICEVYAADGKYHPGKFYSGTCRYPYGGNIVYSSTYLVLQSAPPPAYQLFYIDLGSQSPPYSENTIVASNGSGVPLTVCLAIANSSNGEKASGMVYNNQCQYEYGGSIHYANTFKTLQYLPGI